MFFTKDIVLSSFYCLLFIDNSTVIFIKLLHIKIYSITIRIFLYTSTQSSGYYCMNENPINSLDNVIKSITNGDTELKFSQFSLFDWVGVNCLC